MVRTGQTTDRLLAAALLLVSLTPFARAGDSAERASQVPLAIPHTTNVLLDEQARRAARHRADNVEKADFLIPTPGLRPVTWPKNSDMRQRLLPTQVGTTPVVGWLAENLYRSKNDNGWCL